MGAAGIMQILSGLRIAPRVDEMEIHGAIAQLLQQQSIAFIQEARLGPGDRIDFLTEDGVGIEVKKGRPTPSVLKKQLSRYAKWDSVRELIVIDQKAVSLPDRICGKACFQMGLDRLWGIAL